MVRPFRFAAGVPISDDPARLRRAAARIEQLGYSTLVVADHLMMPFAPLIALQAVADATTTIRVGQLVLAQGFRHPAVLAKELATLDVLSGGRVEVGIGAGWMRFEFDQVGLPFASASVRIEQLEESVIVLQGLFADGAFTFRGRHHAISGLEGTPKPVQRPRPPIMIGGGGRKLLAVAGRRADIVQILPGAGVRTGAPMTAAALTGRAFQEKLDWIRDAAGERYHDLELGVMLTDLTITDNRTAAEDRFLSRLGAPPPGDSTRREDVVASPLVAIGTVEEICDRLREIRDVYGFSYFTAPPGQHPAVLAPVIERLAST